MEIRPAYEHENDKESGVWHKSGPNEEVLKRPHCALCLTGSECNCNSNKVLLLMQSSLLLPLCVRVLSCCGVAVSVLCVFLTVPVALTCFLAVGVVSCADPERFFRGGPIFFFFY